MLNVWGVTVLRSAVTRSRVLCHFLWTRRKQLFLARESFSHSFRSLVPLYSPCRRQSQSSSTSAESRQEEAAAASVTKRENNWVDAELVKPLSSPSRFLQISTSIVTDSPPSSLRASREIHDHHRVANWRHFCCAMQVNRLTLRGQWSTSPRCAARALIYFLLKTVRLYCTCEPDLYKPEAF